MKILGKWIWPVCAGLWAALVVPLLGQLLTGLADHWGWTDDATVASVAAAIARGVEWIYSWYLYAVVAVVTLTIGLFLGNRLTREERDMARELVRLGNTIDGLLRRNDNRHPLAGPLDQRVDDDYFLPRADAINAQLISMGIRVPRVPEATTSVSTKGYLSEFYRRVAPTFRMGNRQSSRNLAKTVSTEIEREVRQI